MELDRIDRDLLLALQDDGRRTVKELAARVDLSPSATHARVQRLRDSGVITGFHAALDPAEIGVGLQAVIQVFLQRHSREALAGFRAHSLRLPEVVAVTHLTGSVDFLVHVAVRDIDHLRKLALDAFTTREEVSRIETAIVYEHVATTGWPVYEGSGGR